MREETQLLLDSTSSSEALRRLFFSLKARAPHQNAVTLGTLCKKAKIPSKGYLSRVLSGKRLLAQKHVDAICEAFQLHPLESEYFKLGVQLEQRLEDDARAAIEQKRETVRRTLQVRRDVFQVTLDDSVFALEVYCAFAILKGRADVEQLMALFGREREDLESALRELESSGLISRQGKDFVTGGESVVFKGSQDRTTHLRFLQSAINHSLRHADQLFSQSAKAFFQSSVITVSKEKYLAKLPNIRSSILKLQTELEDEDPDGLIRFNVQIYPSLLPEEQGPSSSRGRGAEG